MVGDTVAYEWLPGYSDPLEGLLANSFTQPAKAISRTLPKTVLPQVEEPEPIEEPEEQSLLGSVGEKALGGLAYVGETLDKPGKAIRGLLAGRPDQLMNLIPFSDSMGLTSPETSTTGRDLLEQYDIVGKNKPGLFNDIPDFLGDVGGFALEVATDPFTYVGLPGISTTAKGKAVLKNTTAAGRQAGKAARKFVQAEKLHGQHLAKLEKLKAKGAPLDEIKKTEELIKEAGENLRRSQTAHNTSKAADEAVEQLSDKLSDRIKEGHSALWEVGLPFTDKYTKHFGTGEKAAKFAEDYLDKPLEFISDLSPVAYVQGLLKASREGQTTAAAGRIAEGKHKYVADASKDTLGEFIKEKETFTDIGKTVTGGQTPPPAGAAAPTPPTPPPAPATQGMLFQGEAINETLAKVNAALKDLPPDSFRKNSFTGPDGKVRSVAGLDTQVLKDHAISKGISEDDLATVFGDSLTQPHISTAKYFKAVSGGESLASPKLGSVADELSGLEDDASDLAKAAKSQSLRATKEKQALTGILQSWQTPEGRQEILAKIGIADDPSNPFLKRLDEGDEAAAAEVRKLSGSEAKARGIDTLDQPVKETLLKRGTDSYDALRSLVEKQDDAQPILQSIDGILQELQGQTNPLRINAARDELTTLLKSLGETSANRVDDELDDITHGFRVSQSKSGKVRVKEKATHREDYPLMAEALVANAKSIDPADAKFKAVMDNSHEFPEKFVRQLIKAAPKFNTEQILANLRTADKFADGFADAVTRAIGNNSDASRRAAKQAWYDNAIDEIVGADSLADVTVNKKELFKQSSPHNLSEAAQGWLSTFLEGPPTARKIAAARKELEGMIGMGAEGVDEALKELDRLEGNLKQTPPTAATPEIVLDAPPPGDDVPKTVIKSNRPQPAPAPEPPPPSRSGFAADEPLPEPLTGIDELDDPHSIYSPEVVDTAGEGMTLRGVDAIDPFERILQLPEEPSLGVLDAVRNTVPQGGAEYLARQQGAKLPPQFMGDDFMPHNTLSPQADAWDEVRGLFTPDELNAPADIDISNLRMAGEGEDEILLQRPAKYEAIDLDDDGIKDGKGIIGFDANGEEIGSLYVKPDGNGFAVTSLRSVDPQDANYAETMANLIHTFKNKTGADLDITKPLGDVAPFVESVQRDIDLKRYLIRDIADRHNVSINFDAADFDAEIGRLTDVVDTVDQQRINDTLRRLKVLGTIQDQAKAKFNLQSELDKLGNYAIETTPDGRTLVKTKVDEIDWRSTETVPEDYYMQPGAKPKPKVGDARAAVRPQDLNRGAIIYLFQNADPTSFIHEFSHVVRRELDPADLKPFEEYLKNVRPATKKLAAQDNSGFFHNNRPEEGVNWNNEAAEEAFAEMIEEYIGSGRVPQGATPQLAEALNNFKGYFQDVYASSRGMLSRAKQAAQVKSMPPEALAKLDNLILGKEYATPHTGPLHRNPGVVAAAEKVGANLEPLPEKAAPPAATLPNELVTQTLPADAPMAPSFPTPATQPLKGKKPKPAATLPAQDMPIDAGSISTTPIPPKPPIAESAPVISSADIPYSGTVQPTTSSFADVLDQLDQEEAARKFSGGGLVKPQVSKVDSLAPAEQKLFWEDVLDYVENGPGNKDPASDSYTSIDIENAARNIGGRQKKYGPKVIAEVKKRISSVSQPPIETISEAPNAIDDVVETPVAATPEPVVEAPVAAVDDAVTASEAIAPTNPPLPVKPNVARPGDEGGLFQPPIEPPKKPPQAPPETPPPAAPKAPLPPDKQFNRIARKMFDDVPITQEEKDFLGANYDTVKSYIDNLWAKKEALHEEAADYLGSFRALEDDGVGRHAPRFSSDAYVHAAERYSLADSFLNLFRKDKRKGSKLAPITGPDNIARKEALKHFKEGTVGVNDLIRDWAGEKITPAMKAAIKDALAEVPLAGVDDAARKEAQKTFAAHLDEVARYVSGLPKTLKGGEDFFGRSIVDDAHTYSQYQVRKVGSGKAIHKLFADTAGEEGVPLVEGFIKALGKERLKNGGQERILNTFLRDHGKALGIKDIKELENLKVPQESIDAATKFMLSHTNDKTIEPIVKVWDAITQATKAGLTVLWPAFHVRNMVSGMYVNWVADAFDTESYKKAVDLWNGKGSPKDYAELEVEQVWNPNFGVRGVGSKVTDQNFQLADIGQKTEGWLHSYLKKKAQKELEIKGTGQEPSKLTNWWRTWQSGGEATAEMTEFINRTAHFLSKKKQGFSVPDAALSSQNTHFIYSNKTPFEQKYLQRMIPFWTYAKNNIPWELEQLAKNPGGRLGQSIRAAKVAQEGTSAPPWVGSGVALPLGEEEGGNQRFLSGLGLPFEEAFERFEIGPGGLGRTVDNHLSMLNPLIKTPMEMIAGRQFFSGRELRDLQPFPTGNITADTLIYNSPAARAVTTARTAIDPRKGVLTKALNLGSGFRLSDVDMEKARQIEARDLIAAQLEASPNINIFKNYAAKKDRELTPEELALLQGMKDNRKQYQASKKKEEKKP